MADLLLSLIANDQMSDVFGKAKGAVAALGAALVDMTKQAAESERVGAQLSAVAGRLTDDFKRQATAISDQIGIDDEYIQQLQTLELRYGVLPDNIEATTRATLDYAAATGQDARGALEAMLRAAERGTDGVRSLGLVYQSTGDKTKDLTIATKLLEERWHNAAETAANTAEGQWRKVNLQLDNIKESIGAVVLRANETTGALDNLSAGLEGVNHAIERGTLGKFVGAGVGALIGALFGDDETLAEAKARLNDATGDWQEAAKKAIDQVIGYKKKLKPDDGEVVFDDGEVIEGRSAAERAAERAAAARKSAEELRSVFRDNEANVEAYKRFNEEADRKNSSDAQARFRRIQAEERADQSITKSREREIKNREHLEEVAAKRATAILEMEAKSFEDAGIRMGGQLVAGIIGQLKRLDKGGEFDVAAFFGSIFQTALGVLSIVFPGSSALLGAFGSIGNALFRHDGGPIGYFHGGGLPAASTDEQLVLAQHGEYMLSREQVDNMGGPAGVERAASGGGGGGGTVIIQAIDSESLLRHYSGRGGRAFYNAALLGRGSISKLVRG